MEIETSSSAVSPPNDFEMPIISTMGSAFSPAVVCLLVWRVVPVISMGVSSEQRGWRRRQRAPSPWLLLFRRQNLGMLLDELVDVVRGDEQARDLDHFGLGIDPALDVFLGLFGDLLATGDHVDPVRGRHVPVLDRLHGGRLTVDRVDLRAASMRLLDSGDSTESWIVPAGPDGQIFASAWMLREEGVRDLSASRYLSGDRHLLAPLGRLEFAARDCVVDGIFTIDTRGAGRVAEDEQGARSSHVRHHLLRGFLAGQSVGSPRSLNPVGWATPQRDHGDTGVLGSRQAGDQLAAWKDGDQDHVDVLLNQGLHRRHGLVGLSLRIDRRDFVTELLRLALVALHEQG